MTMRLRSHGTSRRRFSRPPASPALLIAAGVVMVVLLHPLRTDVDPTRQYISEYGNQAWSWMLSAALVLVAVGLLALASVLRTTVRARTGPRLLQVAGALLIIAAVCSTDRAGGEVETATLAGRIHGAASLAAFALLVLAMAMLSPRLEGGDRRLGRVGELGLPVALLAVTPTLVAFLVIPEAHGLRQRLFVAIVFAWLLAVAAQVRSLDPGERAGSGRAPAPSRLADWSRGQE